MPSLSLTEALRRAEPPPPVPVPIPRIIVGPATCIECKAHVWLIHEPGRRDALNWCDADGEVHRCRT